MSAGFTIMVNLAFLVERIIIYPAAAAFSLGANIVRNIKLVVSYDGADFHGFQAQPGLRTVQGELEDAILRLTGERVQIHGSGRTDAGVHALGQVINFHTASRIPIEKWPIAMNVNMSADVAVLSAEEAPAEFHARFDARGKIYRYQIDKSTYPNIFTRKYAWHVPQALNMDAFDQALEHLVGQHDFTSFCNAATPLKDKVRTIERIWTEEKEHLLQVYVQGNGFLWNMVRIIAGTAVDAGKGKINADAIPTILAGRDRTLAGVTAPAHGLILQKVLYNDKNNKIEQF